MRASFSLLPHSLTDGNTVAENSCIIATVPSIVGHLSEIISSMIFAEGSDRGTVLEGQFISLPPKPLFLPSDIKPTLCRQSLSKGTVSFVESHLHPTFDQVNRNRCR